MKQIRTLHNKIVLEIRTMNLGFKKDNFYYIGTFVRSLCEEDKIDLWDKIQFFKVNGDSVGCKNYLDTMIDEFLSDCKLVGQPKQNFNRFKESTAAWLWNPMRPKRFPRSKVAKRYKKPKKIGRHLRMWLEDKKENDD